jgi:hypothetical protein
MNCARTLLAALVLATAPVVVAGQDAKVAREALPKALRPTTRPTPAPVNPTARVLPGTRAEAFVTIQGTALTSTNGLLTDATMRLRDARFGRIVGVTTTDRAGLFVFSHVSPGTYVVELLGADQSILAASQLLDVNAGEAVSAVVKLPFRIPFAGALGKTAPSAAVIVATAAASGVLATRVTATDVSPRR